MKKQFNSFIVALIIAAGAAVGVGAMAGPWANSGGGSGGGGGSGTVTSVDGAGTQGVSVTGGPVTGVGTLTIGLGAITPSSVTTGTVTATSINGTLTSVTGTLTGSITGNAATVTTNANLTGPITSTGNATAVAAQTGTGSTFVMQSSPTLNTATFVAPALGTPLSGVMTNATGTAAGLTAGTVTTNANLTGPITSSGNTTAIGAQTGTGSVFVVQSAPTLNTPTFVAPVLGTPQSGVATNLTGTAAGLTAGTVTTNANLTGPITSTGNATAVAAQTGTGSTFVMQSSPTLNTPTFVAPALGTPLSGVMTNVTGIPTTALTGTLAAAQFPALTGDVTTVAGTTTTVLSSVVSSGTCTACSVTFDAKGRATAFSSGSAGSGDVVGPASATDNAIVRFDSTTGKLVQNSSGATLSDNYALSLAGSTVTANEPMLNLTQTWNNAGVSFTGLKFVATSTASAADSKLLDVSQSTTSFSVYRRQSVGAGTASIVLADYTPAMLFTANGGAGTSWGIGNGLTTNDEFYIYRNTGQPTSATMQAYLTSGRFGLKSSSAFGWASGNADAAQDTLLTRRAAATLQHGDADAASPVAQTLTFQGSRGGTDSNVAAVAATIKGSLGTGTGTVGDLIFSTGTVAASGTTQHTAATRLTLNSAGATFAGPVTTGGTITLPGAAQVITSGTQLDLGLGGTSIDRFGNTPDVKRFLGGVIEQYSLAARFSLKSASVFGWTSSADASATVDSGVARNAAGVVEINNGTAAAYRDLKVRQHYIDFTNTATVGAVTINKSAGQAIVAAAATSVVVTNSLTTANSQVLCTVATNDATATLKNCVAAAGSFTITFTAAATADTKVSFLVLNQ